MGIDIQRGGERRRVGGDAHAGQWRGCGSDGDVAVYFEQRDGGDGFGGSAGGKPRWSRSDLDHLPPTKCHFKRDIGNRGDEVGGSFIRAKSDRAASNDTITGWCKYSDDCPLNENLTDCRIDVTKLKHQW